MNCVICGVVVDEKTALEYQKKTFELDGKFVPLRTVELYATSADYSERMPELAAEAKKCCSQIAAELKQLYAPDPDEDEAALHPIFTRYIDDLKKIYEDACIKYDEIFSAVETARKVWGDVKGTPGLGELNLVRAKEAYLTAEQTFKDSMGELRKKTDEKVAAVRDQLLEHSRAFYRADSSKLDNNTLVLLESGILTDNEVESLARKFRNNVTMVRMIGRYSGMRNTDAMRSLTYKIEHLGLDGEAELKLFNEAVIYGNRCIDPKGRNFSEIGRKYFDQSVQGVINEMNGLIVQPMA